MAAAQRQKVDEPKAEARVRLPNVEGPMTKVGLPNAGAGENTVVRYDEGWIAECRAAVDSLSGKRTADAVSAVYEDVIRWQTRHCISCIPRRHFNADKEERCLANRLAVVLRRRKRRLAWTDVLCRARRLACRAKLTKVQTDLINSTPGVSCNDLSSWSQWRRMLRASTASVPHAASADCCHMNTPSELSLRGINIQYPFSRLILFGVKTVEVRTYPLGDRNLGGDYEDLFLIETPGSRNLKGALVDPRYPIGPPPSVAQVIGIVRFSSSEQYANMPTSKYQWHMPSWIKHRSKHRIKEGGHYDWNRKDAMYAWYVDNVQPFSEPVPAGEKCLWGYRRPRTLEVTLM